MQPWKLKKSWVAVGRKASIHGEQWLPSTGLEGMTVCSFFLFRNRVINESTWTQLDILLVLKLGQGKAAPKVDRHCHKAGTNQSKQLNSQSLREMDLHCFNAEYNDSLLEASSELHGLGL